MKKLAWILAVTLALGTVTACGKKDNTESSAATQEEQDAGAGEATGQQGQEAEAGEATGQQGQEAGAGEDGQGAADADQAADAEQSAGAEQSADAGKTASEAGADRTGHETAAVEEPAKTPAAPHIVPGRAEEDPIVILPGFTYTAEGVHEVDGRRGIACDGEEYWVSGDDFLARYDGEWKAVAANEAPFKGLEAQANRISDIDVYNGEIYAVVEKYSGGTVSDMQIVVYDAQKLKMSRTYAINAESGQADCSGIAADPDTQSIWLCSRSEGESGRYLYRYSLESGEYIGKVHLQAAPQWLQGVAYFNGYLYMTADDGTADMGEPDHVYRWRVDPDSTEACVSLERTLDDVEVPGEIGGLTWVKTSKKLLVLHNRGAQITDGVAGGFYEGYDKEIHEVCEYSAKRNAWPMDYSKEKAWVSIPDEEAVKEAKAEVFLVLPSVNMSRLDADNEDVTSLRDALRYSQMFNIEKKIPGKNTAIYSPYYRQWTLGVTGLEEGDEKEQYKEIAREDIYAAFRWYLDECHTEGKPIVLFGYSQGAELVKDILTEFGQERRLSADLAAAYVIGYSITQDDIIVSPWLKMARGEKDTGVIVSFECMDESAELPDVRTLSINPLNWKTDSTEAPASANEGYVMMDAYGNVKEEVPGFCGAYLDASTGILIPTGIENPEKYYVKDVGIWPDGSYHLYDLFFFYNNLKENIATRISAFLKEDSVTPEVEEPAEGATTAAPAEETEENAEEAAEPEEDAASPAPEKEEPAQGSTQGTTETEPDTEEQTGNPVNNIARR